MSTIKAILATMDAANRRKAEANGELEAYLRDSELIRTMGARMWDWAVTQITSGVHWTTASQCLQFRFPAHVRYLYREMGPGLVAYGGDEGDDDGNPSWWRLTYPSTSNDIDTGVELGYWTVLDGNRDAFEYDIMLLRLSGFEDLDGIRHEFC